MKAYVQKLTPPQESSFIYRVKSSPRFPFRWHFHPEYELTLIVRSQGKRFVGDNISDYGDGDLVLLGPNLPHTWRSVPFKTKRTRHQARVIQFTDAFLGDSFFERPETRHLGRFLNRCSQGLHFVGKTREFVAQRMIAMHRISGFGRLVELIKILDLLSQSRTGKPISSAGFVPTLHHTHHRRIDAVCRFINENYTTATITQPQVAGIAHMTPSVFSIFFKKAIGKTFVEYLNDLRISHACQLLIETELSVLEICYHSGFNNLSNFNRRFLKLKRMSPTQYRSQHSPLPMAK